MKKKILLTILALILCLGMAMTVSAVGENCTILEARAAESTTSPGLSNQQKGALVIGIGALGIIAFKSGLLGKGFRPRRRKRK